MNDQKQWILRLVCLGLIALMGIGYQTRALAWQRQKDDNQARIREVEQYNTEIQHEQQRLETEAIRAAEEARALAAGEEPAAVETETEPEIPAVQMFADGSYTASAAGFGGDITVTVTLEADRITDIQVDSHDGEDAVYFTEAMAMVDRILEAQAVDVDIVTGATLSSTGIREAVRQAVLQARSAA